MHSRVATHEINDDARVCRCANAYTRQNKRKAKKLDIYLYVVFFSYSLHHSVRYAPARPLPSIGVCPGAFFFASLHSVPSRSTSRTKKVFIQCERLQYRTSIYQCAFYEPVGPTHSPIQLHHYYFYDYYRKIHWRKLAGQHVSYQMTAIFRPNFSRHQHFFFPPYIQFILSANISSMFMFSFLRGNYILLPSAAFMSEPKTHAPEKSILVL